ncbi:MAG: UDP-N-acetylmuramoyl-L-alanine--D-glutamate ligase, partial [Nitrospirae bacterium]|nr:UDP-N-acetylmuramoyl-L-alanine--D-glutamate ligase [Nitrospirota bacterium]
MDFKDKKITVVGLARSGVGASNLLNRLGASVTATDKKGEDELRKFIKLLETGVKTVIGSHPYELFENADMVVLSPGIPLDIPPLKKSLAKGIKIIGELELAYQFVTRQRTGDKNCRPEFIAITGTNGKSTTTTLVYEMLKNSGLNVIIGGNIGKALTDEISNLEFQISNLDVIVAEVSSFQLETIDEFRPAGSAVLNI